MSFFRWLLLLIALAAVALFARMHAEARADPIVRRATIGLPGWPANRPAVRLLLMSDIHIGSASMDVARLRRIVGQANALSPDLIVLAGDFVNGDDAAPAIRSAALLTAPLSGLSAPLGVVATLGNHDGIDAREYAAVASALRAGHVRVLDNKAVVAGPLVLAGIGDVFTHHDRTDATLAAAARLRGVPVAISHAPEIRHYLAGRIGLLVTGHTHCGQIYLPRHGIDYYGPKKPYRCGIVTEPGKVTVITAGLGTSLLPLRLNAPPDMWLLTLGPIARPGRG